MWKPIGKPGKIKEGFGKVAKFATLIDMKKFIFQTIVLLVVVFGGLTFYTSKIPFIPFIQPTATFKQMTVNGNTLKVEIADSKEKRNKGLSGRDSLATDSGMLFIFDKADKYPFWMKGLKFPLDFIWIRNNIVVDFLQNIQFPQTGRQDSTLTVYAPKVPIDMVLEVNAGLIKQFNIKEGDVIKIID